MARRIADKWTKELLSEGSFSFERQITDVLILYSKGKTQLPQDKSLKKELRSSQTIVPKKENKTNFEQRYLLSVKVNTFCDFEYMTIYLKKKIIGIIILKE